MSVKLNQDGTVNVGIGVADKSAWKNDVWNSGGDNLPNNCGSCSCGSAGSAVLPPVTVSDVGKALVVKQDGYTAGATIVPEQTVYFDADANTFIIPTFDGTDFVEGAIVTANINGITFTGQVTEEGLSREGDYDAGDPYSLVGIFWGDDDVLCAWYSDWDDNHPAEMIVSANVAVPVAKWDKGNGGGYDIEIVCNHEPSGAAYTDLTIIGGSIEAVEAKVAEGKIPTGKLAFFYQVNDHNECRICDLAWFDADYSVLRFTNVEQLTTGDYVCVVGFNSSYAITSLAYA